MQLVLRYPWLTEAQSLSTLLEAFYEQLTTTASQPLAAGMTGDASMLTGVSSAAGGHLPRSQLKADERAGLMFRRLERLAVRLDYNGSFSAPRTGGNDGDNVHILGDL